MGSGLIMTMILCDKSVLLADIVYSIAIQRTVNTVPIVVQKWKVGIKMAMCKKCTHKDVCLIRHLKDATICPHFKDYTKYVEVAHG